VSFAGVGSNLELNKQLVVKIKTKNTYQMTMLLLFLTMDDGKSSPWVMTWLVD
jgi:hypothetical protein